MQVCIWDIQFSQVALKVENVTSTILAHKGKGGMKGLTRGPKNAHLQINIPMRLSGMSKSSETDETRVH